MKRSMRMWLATGFGCAIVAAGIVPTVLERKPAPATAPAMAAAARPQPSMQAMNRAFGTLRGQIADATKNAASLELLSQIQTAALAAKSAMPPLIAALPEAEQPAKVKAYKAEMLKLIRQTLDAEEALLANDNAKAGEAVTAMAATQRGGHAEFRPQRGGARRGA